jgi:NitT/TauT family transport system substrate-binding protein
VSPLKTVKIAAILIIAILIALMVTYFTIFSKPVGSKNVIIKFSYQPSDHHLPAFIILSKKWIESEAAKLGYNVTVVEKPFPSGPPQVERFLAGDVDVMYVGAAPAISAVAKYLEAKQAGRSIPQAIIVAIAQYHGSALVLKSGLNYTGPESLIGKVIATYPPGSIQYTIMINWLKNNGLKPGDLGDPNANIYIKPVSGPQEQVELLSAGKVDAIFTPSPTPEICEIKNIGKIAISSGDMMLNHPCCVLALSREFYENYPELAKLLVKLHVKAERYITENTVEAIEIGASKLSELWGYNTTFTKYVLMKVFTDNKTKIIFNPDPSRAEGGLTMFTNAMYNLGLIKIKPEINDLLNKSIYSEVAEETS